jgi:RNA polymerase sigma-70 factor (ECF subfamily)
MNSEFGTRLQAALATMSEELREVFVMREIGNVPFQEIARIAGIPENTAKSRMRYALEHLRRELSDFADMASGA